jgi:hypothetical protein
VLEQKISLYVYSALVQHLTVIICVNNFRWLRYIDKFSMLLNTWRGWGGRNCCMKCVQPISITTTILSLLVAAVAICTTASAAFSVPSLCFPYYLFCMDKCTMKLRTVMLKHTQVNNLLTGWWGRSAFMCLVFYLCMIRLFMLDQ